MPQGTPTQTFVPIQEVRDGIAILKDGSMRAVLLASSINFALKSRDEQTAILSQFQAFLNTLDFSIQIYVQSRRLDIQPYIEHLKTREVDQNNDLIRVQLREYMGFIQSFTEEVDIMTKSFFVVVPYSPLTANAKENVAGVLNQIKNLRKSTTPAVDTNRFEEHRMQIEQRMGIVTSGLNRVSVRTAVLGTDEIIELFYHLFNPDEENKPLPL